MQDRSRAESESNTRDQQEQSAKRVTECAHRQFSLSFARAQGIDEEPPP